MDNNYIERVEHDTYDDHIYQIIFWFHNNGTDCSDYTRCVECATIMLLN